LIVYLYPCAFKKYDKKNELEMITFRTVNITLFFVLSLIIMCFTTQLSAQQGKFATPLQPEDDQTQREIGLFVGIGPNFQMGSFRTQCDCPDFENGTGFGWNTGVLYEQDINSDFQFGAALGINSLDITSSYQYNKERAFTSTITGFPVTDTVPILFEQEAQASFLNFTAMPYLKWSAADFFFARFGIEAGFNITSNIKQTEEILQKTVKIPSTGEIVTVSFADGSSVSVAEDGEFPNVITPQINLVPAVGFNLKLAKNIFLSPVFSFSYPLTNMSDNGNNFSINNLRFIAELRWALTMRSR